jgi:hypothetical protein
VTNLKNEILERYSTFVKPLIAIVRDLSSKTEFDETRIDKYAIEIFGGNHRREALMQLEKEGKLDEGQMNIRVQLYLGMYILQL